jgi:hypothetical protein
LQSESKQDMIDLIQILQQDQGNQF